MEWKDAIKIVRKHGYRIPVSFPKDSLPYPSVELGFRKSTGEPEGQKADFRMRVEGKSSLHVKVYKDRYLVHIDQFDPWYNALLHIVFDAPEILFLISTAVVGLFYATKVIYRSKKEQRWYKTLIYYALVIAISVFIYLFVKTIREIIDRANDRRAPRGSTMIG